MVGNYNRLPLKMKGVVGERLWQLSQNSAGLKIRFKTNAQEIIVRYVVNQEFDMPHMPATGVSGLVIRKDGQRRMVVGCQVNFILMIQLLTISTYFNERV